MMSEAVRYRLFYAYIRPYYQSLLNIFPVLSANKKEQIEALNRQTHRVTHQWHEARNIEVAALDKFQSIAELTTKHWRNLTNTILRTNPAVIEDYLQHKLSIVYLKEYLSNPVLAKERRAIFGRGRIRKHVIKLAEGESSSLLDLTLAFTHKSTY